MVVVSDAFRDVGRRSGREVFARPRRTQAGCWLAAALVAAPLLLGALGACQGRRAEPAGTPPAGSGADARVAIDAAGSAARDGGDAADGGGLAGSAGSGATVGGEDEPAPPPPSVAQLIAELGAIPAWEGVVQRGQLLARRNQRGVLYGRIGPAAGEGAQVWLIDDTEGEGSLAARVAFPGAPPPAGARVAVTGAWVLPAGPGSRWVWQAERSTGLPEESAAGRGDAAPSPIGHEPVVAPRPPEAVPISRAKDGDLVAFQVLAAPRRLGEAWLVGDQLGSPPVAMLALPGDRQSYGGIDFRQPDEQWRLRRGVTYVVRIGKIRRKDPAKPATINARNAPIKIS
jgi:hypothetical protein